MAVRHATAAACGYPPVGICHWPPLVVRPRATWPPPAWPLGPVSSVGRNSSRPPDHMAATRVAHLSASAAHCSCRRLCTCNLMLHRRTLSCHRVLPSGRRAYSRPLTAAAGLYAAARCCQLVAASGRHVCRPSSGRSRCRRCGCTVAEFYMWADTPLTHAFMQYLLGALRTLLNMHPVLVLSAHICVIMHTLTCRPTVTCMPACLSFCLPACLLLPFWHVWSDGMVVSLPSAPPAIGGE